MLIKNESRVVRVWWVYVFPNVFIIDSIRIHKSIMLMRKHLSTYLFIFLGLVMSSLTFADEIASKHHICIACHTHNAKSIFPGPQLGGLPSDYIYQQLENFKLGLRGGDAETEMMKNVVLGLTERQAKGLSEWASELEVVPVFDIDKATDTVGFKVYEAKCQDCHNSFIGRFMTDSPRLDGLDSGYILKQIALFKSGSRTVAEPSKHQAKMISVIKSLTDEEFLSLTTFIKQAGQ